MAFSVFLVTEGIPQHAERMQPFLPCLVQFAFLKTLALITQPYTKYHSLLLVLERHVSVPLARAASRQQAKIMFPLRFERIPQHA
jgi:hypothetical protein